MRRGRNSGLLKNPSGQLMGINLGADYCAEHEWGIKELRKMFKMDENALGIAKRTITALPESKAWGSEVSRSLVRLVETKTKSVLLVGDYCTREDWDMKRSELSGYGNDMLVTAWDEKSFGINATTEKDRAAVKEIYNAMMNKDLAIWLGGGGVFENAGLVLVIVSRIPKESTQMLHDADVGRIKLNEASEATGIAMKLEATGKRYYALSPKWKRDVNSIAQTKFNVVYWLNPMDQDNNNFGWFTVEQLEEWAQGKGPVLKTEKQKRERYG